VAEPDVGVYVHVPFCERVCPYCDFAVVAARPLAPEAEDAYVAALLAELAVRGEAFEGRRLATLYLGGGTPSLLSPPALARIVASVRAAFPGAPEEVTLEVNPSTLERERLPQFREAGVDRVSIGVQSFDDTVLKRLGRAHRAEEIDRTLEACGEAGFARWSLDLIVAAPGQSREDVDADLSKAIAASPDHLSVYELTLEPGTPFGDAAARGRLARPDEEAAAEQLECVERRLGAAGYGRYEISSYARPGREAVHNRRYWQRRPVLGLGMGAVSNDPATADHPFGVRRANPRGLAAYLAAAASGGGGSAEVLSPAQARGEAMFLALRTREGVDETAFEREFGSPARHFFGAAIERLVDAGLLRDAAGRLRLTPRGRMLSDSVFEHFI
jgi:oxygen-independent coproporphyrinogen-3 oxidase